MLCNFIVYQGRRAKFGRLGYFDVYFSKSYRFLKLKACHWGNFLFSRSLGSRDAESKHKKPYMCAGFSFLFLACLAAGAILKRARGEHPWR